MARKIEGYWMLICKPNKWAIDRFLEQRITIDSWGVGDTYIDKIQKGHLAILRVGIDDRTKEQLQGRKKLKAGIYAICEIISDIYSGTGTNDDFWEDGQHRPSGFPTVDIKYLQIFDDKPISVERLKSVTGLDPKIVTNHQGALLPILEKDFIHILELAEIEIDQLNVSKTDLKSIENAAPIVKNVISKRIERGPQGNEAKKRREFKCQICDAMGQNPLGFTKRNKPESYVEAHHVIPVSTLENDVLSIRNIMVVCANHHRWLHYGSCEVEVKSGNFVIKSEDFKELVIPRLLSQIG